MRVRSSVVGGSIHLLISLVVVGASRGVSITPTDMDVVNQREGEAQKSEVFTSTATEEEKLPADTMFVVVATPAHQESCALRIDALLSYKNPRPTDTIREHFDRIAANTQSLGRQSCPAQDTVWNVKPKDALLVKKGAHDKLRCAEGGAYTIGKVDHATGGTRTTRVILEDSPIIEQRDSTTHTQSVSESSLVVSNNLLGARKNRRRTSRGAPLVETGDLVILVCAVAQMPIVVLQRDNVALSTGDISETAISVDIVTAWPTRVEGGSEGASQTYPDAIRAIVKPVVGSPDQNKQPLLLTLDVQNTKEKGHARSLLLDAKVNCFMTKPPASWRERYNVYLQCFGGQSSYTRRRKERSSMTSSRTMQIPDKGEKFLNRVLNFLTYGSALSASMILAGHGLLAVDHREKGIVSEMFTGYRYVAGEYNPLRVFISPQDIGDYYRAQSTANLKIAAEEVRTGRHIRAGLGYLFAGAGVRAVNTIFPIFLVVLLAYLVHRPLLFPVQKIYEYLKRKKEASKFAAATRSSVEIKSLCPPKRILVSCAGLQERLKMMRRV